MTVSNLPYQSGSTPTTAFTKAMTDAFSNAVTVMNNTVGSGKLDDLSIPQLAQVIEAFQEAYNTFAGAIVSPASINLDALPSSASTIDGWNAFTAAVNNAAAESDINTVLAYISRILQNLKRATG